MKLLFLAHRIPYPPNKGDKIRSWRELRSFVERGHEVHLLAFADDARDLGYQAELARVCESVRVAPLSGLLGKVRALGKLPTRQPLSVGYYASSQMKRLVKQALAERDFDVVFVYSSTMAQYAPSALQSRTVVDLVDVDSEKWRDYARRSRPPKSWLYKLESRRLRSYEHAVASRFAYTILTTAREAALLDELDEFTRRSRLRLISNGVDLDYFRPDEGVVKSSPPRLVFTGAMDYYANVDGACWFVEKVFPLIRAEAPEAELLIVGGNPTAGVRKLARRAGVTVTGYVDDVRPYLLNATACVVPLRIARGVQNKVLEAMATGKPVVATSAAVAGLRVQAGLQLLVADDPNGFAQATLTVMRDEALSADLGFEARRFVEVEHAWEPFLERLNQLVETAGARRATDANAKPRPLARGRF